MVKKTMKKINFVIFGIFIFTLFVITLFIQINKSRETTPAPNMSPIFTVTPEPIPTGAEKPLDIISTQPEDKAKDVSLSDDIIISFNRLLSSSEIIFEISPNLSYSTVINGNSLVIKHAQPFSPGVIYTYIIRYRYLNQAPRTRSFTIIGPTQTNPPNTAPTGLFEEQDRVQREKHPDIFLANQTPYFTDDFSVSSDFKKTPIDHFYFIVTVKGEDKTAAKNNFIVWLKSLGLTDSQIQGLDITYY